MDYPLTEQAAKAWNCSASKEVSFGLVICSCWIIDGAVEVYPLLLDRVAHFVYPQLLSTGRLLPFLKVDSSSGRQTSA